MNFTDMLRDATAQNNSLLCVGLDPEPTRFPAAMQGDPRKIYDFCAAIVDATADLVCAFKPQIAYFAAHGAEDQLERLMQHMRANAPQVPVILDAKRGDIGSTAEQYAKEAFERYGADAVTLSPFMGYDSVEPYLQYHGKGAFLLCRTSNPGGNDLQAQRLASVEGQPTGSQMLEMALTFEANQDMRFKSAIRLQNGGVQMSFVQDDDAQTLQKMQVFDRFSIGCPVFWNGDAYRIDARLRYRVRDGKLTFWFELIRQDKVLEDATSTLIGQIKEKTGTPFFFGNPFANS